MRRARTIGAVGVAAAALGAAGVGLALRTQSPLLGTDAPVLGCVATAGSDVYQLDLEQAQNAATIAAVAKRRGLDDHAVTVALATVMQESKLYNLEYGDRDSLGLFQQRPSQGWGTTAQVLDPVHASNKFYDALLNVPHWKSLPVAEAAQAVQQSGFPTAYAQWEDEARTLARVLTGEVAAGLTCTTPTPPVHGTRAQVLAAVQHELGTPALGRSLPPARGWTVSSWLVAHAAAYGIDQVTYARRTWTAAGGWTAGPVAAGPVTFHLATLASPTPATGQP